MAGTTKCDYVKNFEREDKCLPNSWIVVRVTGKSFAKFTEQHGFEKPNDKMGISLMVRSAVSVMEEMRDISLAYGFSDEFNFVFRKDTTFLNRYSSRIMSTVNSLFTSAYVFYWNTIFPATKLKYPPGFESVIMIYPSDSNLRDYISWRQMELHTRNVENTLFCTMVTKGNRTEQEAKETLRSTNQKAETLFREFGINYFHEPEQFRRGTALIRKLINSYIDGKLKQFIIPLHTDLSGDEFWKENLEILGLKSLQVCHKKINHVNAYLVNKPNHLPDPENDNENSVNVLNDNHN